MKYFNKVDGDNIYLSPVSIEDAETYVKWISDPEISDKLHNTSKLFNVLSEQDWINNCLKNGDYNFAIVRKSDDKLIGNCGFNSINHIDGTATVGIFIGDKENQNKGYGSEALKALLKYGFGVLNLNNIDLHVFDFNQRAINCYKKVGFKEYGRRHKAYYINNEYHDVISMEILKEDYYMNV
jgi:RimJ/RimL family protein N-acetyltransferase